MATKLKTTDRTELATLSQEFFNNNTAMNASKRKAEAAKKALIVKLDELGLDAHTATCKDADGKTIKLDSTLTYKETAVIDVKKLSKQIPSKQFWQVISATKKAVTDICGTLVADKVSVLKKSDKPSLSVKKA